MKSSHPTVWRVILRDLAPFPTPQTEIAGQSGQQDEDDHQEREHDDIEGELGRDGAVVGAPVRGRRVG